MRGGKEGVGVILLGIPFYKMQGKWPSLWYWNYGLCHLKQEGASEEDINSLSKYMFRTMRDADKLVAGIAAPVCGVMTECDTDPPIEHIISAEDAVSSWIEFF